MILGPAYCIGCGTFVWWDGSAWHERVQDGYRRHLCAVRRAA